MNLPDYWMTRPGGDAGEETSAAFDGLLRSTLELGGNHAIPYALTAPKWQFLCHAAERHNLALHGSGRPDISVFEPRQSVDLNPFGNRKAVYAASDGIWSMFFAVVDRDSHVKSVSNACIRLVRPGGRVDGRSTFFLSASRRCLLNPGVMGWSTCCHPRPSTLIPLSPSGNRRSASPSWPAWSR
jgi:hypothetical protein